MKNTKVENKIKELVPEIMELKFGCEVKYKDYTGTFISYILGEPDIVYLEIPLMRKTYTLSEVEILGRPITLEDVLRACAKKLRNKFTGNDPKNFIIGGKDGSWIGVGEIKKLLRLWKLDKPLSEQSPETINFLWSILK